MKELNCKIFSANVDEGELEKKINKWLDNNELKDIEEFIVVKYFLIVIYKK